MQVYDSSKVKRNNVIVIVGVICSLVVLYFSYSFPQNKWDLLGHLGGAVHFSTSDPVEIHNRTYSIARDTLAAEAYSELLNGNEVREVWAEDASAFYQVLPFYEPRVLVTYPTYLALMSGINPINYMRLQSSVAAAFGVLLFSLIFARYANIQVAILFPVLILVAGVLDVARFEGADAFAFFGYALVAYLFDRRSIWVLVVLALLPLTRSDMVIYCLPVLFYCLLLYKGWRVKTVLATAVCLGVYFWVNHAFDNYGWVIQFYVALIEYQTHPADVELSFSVAEYLTATLQGVRKLIYNHQFQAFLLALFVVCCALLNRVRAIGAVQIVKIPEESMLILGLLAGIFVFAHFVVFPLMHTRYFAAQYLHVLIIATITTARWAQCGNKHSLIS